MLECLRVFPFLDFRHVQGRIIVERAPHCTHRSIDPGIEAIMNILISSDWPRCSSRLCLDLDLDLALKLTGVYMYMYKYEAWEVYTVQ
jgi:hypothetical protein